MHRTSILTRMSSAGGDSVASTDDGSGIACSPSSRASLSVLTPDNRKFLDSQGSKSPEMPRRRMIIGQRSFTFDTDGDLIEDLTPKKETVTSPTLPPKPPLVHKDSIISSVTSLTSCDSDSDTDSAPNLRRSTSARSSGGRVAQAKVRGSGSTDSLTGPWPLGKRTSVTSLSSWEEMGDEPGSSAHFTPTRGQRPRFLSIDEGDNECAEGLEEGGKNNWIIGSVEDSGRGWMSPDDKQGYAGDEAETGSRGGGSRVLGSEKEEDSCRVGESSQVRENSVNEGLWELELDQSDVEDKASAPPVDVPKTIVPPVLNPPEEIGGGGGVVESQPKTVISSSSAFAVVGKDSAIVESVVGNGATETLERKGGEVRTGEPVSVDDHLPSTSSQSNFSSCSSAHESSTSSLSARRGSLKRQTKVEVEEEATVVSASPVDMAVDALNETPRATTPNSQSEGVSVAEPLQQVSEVSSVVAEPVYTNHSSSAVKFEEVPCVPKREGETKTVKEEERQRRALSPHGRSGSAHSDSSGFLEWEPLGSKATAAVPLRPAPPSCTLGGGSDKGHEWMVTEESGGQLQSEDGTSVGSSAYYGVDGLSSEMTGQQLQTSDSVELALRALRRTLGGEADGGDDSVGREVAIGGGNWQESGLASMGGASREGVEEDTLQQTHQELAFVREMRCCVSEGMDRVMQFYGTWGKRRHGPRHSQMGELEGDAVKVSSIMTQMTFLLKQQSKLCYEMEQLSMQRLLNGQIMGAPGREKMSEVESGPPRLGIKGEERGGTVVIHGKGVVKGNFLSQPTSPQCSVESGANSREVYLEGVVEQNARELAELKLLLKAVLTPNNSNGRS